MLIAICKLITTCSTRAVAVITINYCTSVKFNAPAAVYVLVSACKGRPILIGVARGCSGCTCNPRAVK